MSPNDYQPSDRRPIASRNTGWARAASEWLAGRNVSANAISVAGMFSGVLSGAALAITSITWSPLDRIAWLGGALFAQLRLVGNLLDGMVAIASGKASPVGELYNEIPDRISDSAILIGLGYAAGGSPMCGWLAALAAMFTAYVRAQGKAAGAPSDFGGPMAKQQRMFVVTLGSVLCAALPSAWRPMTPDGWGLAAGALVLIGVGSFFTAMLRLFRIAAALRQNRQ
ncbi:MAG: CDP-alcohol phosphatidyltransferase family protein [Planctomycetes bacterium]|nr:CDP-alcohol phosphatidyltransferase family protein [Planctomycetota bacterium]